MPGQISKDVVIKLKAFSDGSVSSQFKAIEENAKRMGRNVNEVIESLSKMKTPARTAGQAVSALFLDMRKQATEGEKKVVEMTAAFKRLGLSVRDVQVIAKDLGKEFNLTAAQVERLNRAGRSGGGLSGIGRGAADLFGGPAGLMGTGAALLRGGVGILGGQGGHIPLADSVVEETERLRARGVDPGLRSNKALIYGSQMGSRLGFETSEMARRRQGGQQDLVTYYDPDKREMVTTTPEEKRQAELRHKARLYLQREETGLGSAQGSAEVALRAGAFEAQRQAGESIASTRDIGLAERLGLRTRETFAAQGAGLGQRIADVQRAAAPTAFAGVAGVGLEAQAEAMRRFSEQAGIRVGESRSSVFMAEEHGARMRRQATQMQQRFQGMVGNEQFSDAQRSQAAEEYARALERAKEAEQTILVAKREHAKLMKEINMAQRDQIQQQIQQVRGQRVGEEMRQLDQRVDFALMPPDEQQRVLNIMRRLKGGGLMGQGRPGQIMRGPMGGFFRVPGVGPVAPEELAKVRGLIPQEQFREWEKQLEKAQGPGGNIAQFRDMMRGFIGGDKAGELRKAEQELLKIKNEIEVKIKADEGAIRKELEEKLIPKIIDAMGGASKAVEEKMKQELEAFQRKVLANQRAAGPR